MNTYEISNRMSGVFLGAYDGESEAEALDALARDAGYKDYNDACRITSWSIRDDEIIVLKK